MDEITAVLGHVPQHIQDHGSAREKLEAIWRSLGFSRTGMQQRVAADLAEKWYPRNQPPRLPVDDPKAAAKRLEKALNGETSLSLDLSLTFISVLPPAYRLAAKSLVFPSGSTSEPGDLMSVLQADADDDNTTDRIRFALARCRGESVTPEQAEAMAVAFDRDAASSKAVADELRAMAAQKRQGVV